MLCRLMMKAEQRKKLPAGRWAVQRYAIVFVLLCLTLIGMPLQAAACLLRWRKAQDCIPRMYHRLGLRLLGVRVMSEGIVCNKRAVLFVSNHVSWLDIAVLSSLVPVSFVAKSEVRRWPLIGWLARLQGTVFIDRRSRIATRDTAKAMAERFEKGARLVLFAEGTSSSGARVLPMRSSLLGSALQTDGEGVEMWVQPVAIRYETWRGLPLAHKDRACVGWYGSMDLLPHFAGIIRWGGIDVRLFFGKPQRVAPPMNRKQVMQQLEQEIRILRQRKAD